MPFLRAIELRHVFWILALFWAMWVYSEVSEYRARAEHEVKVNEFMNRGDRFTKQRGDELEARIERVEKEVENAGIQ